MFLGHECLHFSLKKKSGTEPKTLWCFGDITSSALYPRALYSIELVQCPWLVETPFHHYSTFPFWPWRWICQTSPRCSPALCRSRAEEAGSETIELSIRRRRRRRRGAALCALLGALPGARAHPPRKDAGILTHSAHPGYSLYLTLQL